MDPLSYEDFRAQYEKMHPASVPQKRQQISEFPRWLQPLALVMFLAASLVSGAHTTTTIRATLAASELYSDSLKSAIAYAAFFAFEVALFVSVYSWIRKFARWLSWLTTGIVFAVIVLANLKDVAQSVGIVYGEWMSQLIVFGVGIGTPLVALLSGKMFVDVYRSGRTNEEKAQAEYQKALEKWDREIEREFEKQNPVNLGASKVSNEVSNRPSNQSPAERVLNYIQNNEDWQELSKVELGRRANASRSTVYNVLDSLSENGHSEPSN